MGLDISYYGKIGAAVDPALLDEDGDFIDWEQEDEHVRIYANEDFPARADGLESGYYKGEREGSLRAGSYGGYNQWRMQLCMAALGVPPTQIWDGTVTEGPFYELVNFSDCEGVIGPKTSAKLAKDFADWEEKIGGMVDGDSEYFMKKFGEWKLAFETAANTGAVCFH